MPACAAGRQASIDQARDESWGDDFHLALRPGALVLGSVRHKSSAFLGRRCISNRYHSSRHAESRDMPNLRLLAAGATAIAMLSCWASPATADEPASRGLKRCAHDFQHSLCEQGRWTQRLAQPSRLGRGHHSIEQGGRRRLARGPRRQVRDLADACPTMPGTAWAETTASRPASSRRSSTAKIASGAFDQATYWLSTSPRKAGSKSWDSSLPRIVSGVKLEDMRTKQAFSALNTHFDHRGETARRNSAQTHCRAP